MIDVVPAGARHNTERGEALLAAMLTENPHAIVVAMDGDGRVVGFPSSIVRNGQQIFPGRTGLEVLAPSSRQAAFETFARALSIGAATVPVTLANQVEAEYHLIDVRGRHGVLVGMVIHESGADLAASLAQGPPVKPKTGRVDKDGVAMISFADDRICEILGYRRDELVGTRALDLIHPDDQPRSIDTWLEMLGNPGGATRLRARHRRHDGSWLWMELTNTNLLDAAEGCVVTEMMDVSEEMTALEHLRQREELLTRLTEALPSGVVHLDRDRNVMLTNGRLHRLLGVEPAATFEAQFVTVAEEDRPALEAALEGVLASGQSADLTVRLHLPGVSTEHRASIAIRALTDDRDVPAGAVLAIDDVTDASALRAELERRATTDGLTGCLNRSAVLAVLDDRLSHHRNASRGMTVVFLDLDGFKEVNDEFGHQAGDRLLTRVAARITGVLRDGDVLGRVGGDEFLVVASAVDSVDDAMRLALRIRDALVDPLELVGEVPMQIRSSIGVAWSGAPNVTATDLTGAADRAMYQSKRDGASEPVAASL